MPRQNPIHFPYHEPSHIDHPAANSPVYLYYSLILPSLCWLLVKLITSRRCIQRTTSRVYRKEYNYYKAIILSCWITLKCFVKQLTRLILYSRNNDVTRPTRINHVNAIANFNQAHVAASVHLVFLKIVSVCICVFDCVHVCPKAVYN